MPNLQSELIAFIFVDPTKLKVGDTVDSATTMTVMAWYQGQNSLDGFNWHQNPRMVSRFLNVGLAPERMVHRKGDLERERRKAGEYLTFYYCSRCARPFRDSSRCAYCKITFTLRQNDSTTIVGKNTPTIPPKIVMYARRNRKTFVYSPPSA